MPKHIRFLCLSVFLFLFPTPAFAQTIEGKAIKVTDGDSITILDSENMQYSIRVNGIDAPEKAQQWGDRARQNMVRLVAGKAVTAECHKNDYFGRPVCTVWVQPAACPTCTRTLDVGYAQIHAGLAWWYREYAKEQSPDDRGRYESAEDEAKARKVGLWHDPNPTPPWEWRRNAKGKP